jgi:biotin transport system substrate-specific component
VSDTAKTTPATDLALIAVFAALIAAFSLTPGIPIGIGVPITLQTLAVVLAGLVLGPWRGAKQYLGFFLAGLGASIVIHAAGILGLMLVAKLDFGAALLLDLTFWPGDLAKMFVAGAIAVAVHKAFPALLVHRQPAVA